MSTCTHNIFSCEETRKISCRYPVLSGAMMRTDVSLNKSLYMYNSEDSDHPAYM